jgi:His/Glu/Gln/Arg/opine family amino acid ABC transporter permease subunit
MDQLHRKGLLNPAALYPIGSGSGGQPASGVELRIGASGYDEAKFLQVHLISFKLWFVLYIKEFRRRCGCEGLGNSVGDVEKTKMDFQWNIFVESIPALLKGAWVTLQLTVISVSIGLVIGLFGGLGRVSSRALVSRLMLVYVTVMRGIPLLVTLMFLYYGLPAVGIQLTAFTVALLALSVTNGAYVTEIIRAGIQSIDSGQMRAARSLGMSYALAMRRIILPQVVRRVLPPVTNEAITLLKNTALVSTIALSDLLRAGLEVMTWKANTFSPFAGVALIYLLMTLPLIWLVSRLEKRFAVPGTG